MSGQLKRKFEEVNEDHSSPTTLDSSPNNPGSPAANFTIPSLKRSKKTRLTHVTFGQVTKFSFPRCQGFTAVPHQGGCTLGMMPRHSRKHTYTLTEFTKKQISRRRRKLLKGLKKVEQHVFSLLEQSKEESQQCGFAEQLQVGNIPQPLFPQACTPQHRYALLKEAGVQRIDEEEETQLQNLRTSRQNRGCDCRGSCEPTTCSCSLAGIKCQLKNAVSVCRCTEDGCGNTHGRIQFNRARVQAHYRSTMLRLKSETGFKEHQTEEEEEDTSEGTSCRRFPTATPDQQ